MKTLAARFPFLFAITTAVMAMLCLVWPLWFFGLSHAVQIIIMPGGIRQAKEGVL